MKVKGMGITEILRRIWLFSSNKIKSHESFSKQPTQLIVKLNSSLWYIIITQRFDTKWSEPVNKRGKFGYFAPVKIDFKLYLCLIPL